MRKLLILGCGVLACVAALAQGTMDAEEQARFKRRLTQAKHYLVEFEKEVARARGSDNRSWHSKSEALDRIRSLREEYPGNADVEALFKRARAALMRSKGNMTDVQDAWTQYKRNEEKLRKMVWAEGEAYWRELLEEAGTNVIERLYPTPDPKKVSPSDIEGKLVVLDDVMYPVNQFYGGTGEYIWCGKPSEGYYYVALDGRSWLGPYEAVKRYRRNVDSSLQEVMKWTVLGRVTGLVCEFPDGNPEKVGNMHWGWVVEPLALMVPDHVVSYYKGDAPSSGVYVGEEKVAAAKEATYTVKEVPANVAPRRLMEIFLTAIREKNFKLYQACIDPECFKTPIGVDSVRYHWDLHQERFHGEYVHATFGPAQITVVKGYDATNEDDNYFLEEEQIEKVAKHSEPVVKQAVVESRALDQYGKQLGSPVRHRLVQRRNGRWYVANYEVRF